ncbi:MAG: gliding motility-associated C-terminal domain-containing protein, partial [Saprospiraceae bacterium]|nr:gliding motility-associated C-terminal domain-containing protein [Saprospiraceae bacterium]
CLEEINNGPANGLWTITVADITGSGSGVIESFDISFCNSSGLTCSDCVLNSGRIDANTESFCGSDPMLSSIRISPTVTGFEPDPALYSYRYVVVFKGNIIQISEIPDLSGQAKGDYQIYGLSIANQDLGRLTGMLGRRIGILRNELNPRRLLMCGQLTRNAKVVKILSSPGVFHVLDTFVCLASPIQFGSRLITEAGIYVETLTSPLGCDSIVELRVKEFEATIPIVPPSVLTCNNKPLNLSWTNEYVKEPSYLWSTIEGSILSDPRQNNVEIDLPGNYQLAMSLEQCKDTLSVVVSDDGSLPQLDLRDVVMDCSQNVGLLRPVSDATSFQWSGPFGFSSSDKNIDVLEPGPYTLVASGTNCAVRKTIQVSADFDAPEDVVVEGATIRCAMDTVQLSASSATPGVSYAWTGPNGFNSSEQNPMVFEVGIYIVRVISPTGGCAIQRQVEVVSIFNEPAVTITGTTLDCQGLRKRIQTTVNDPFASFLWTGPGGFTSTDKSPLVSTPGAYRVQITDGRQCVYEHAATVTIDTVRPVVTASDIDLACTQQDFMLTANISSLHMVDISWQGPNNYTANIQPVPASQVGSYSVRVRDRINGCSDMTTLEVNPHPMQPVLRTENGVINCTLDRDTLILNASCSGGCDIEWTGPAGFSFTGDSAEVQVGGNYIATVTDLSSGCSTKGYFTVRTDTVPLRRDANVRSIGCTTSGEVTLLNSASFTDFFWIDNNSTDTSYLPTYTSSSPTTLDLHTLSQNGCEFVDRYEIDQMDEVPELTIDADAIDCANTSVSVRASISNYPGSQVQSFDWTLPGGVKSTDATPLALQPGNVFLEVIMRNGCRGSALGLVDTNFAKPLLTAIGGGFRCRDPGMVLDFVSDSDPIFTGWSGPDAFASSTTNPMVTTTGIYTLDILGANGCVASDTATVYYTDPLPELALSGDTITCLEPSADLDFVTTARPGYNFKWLDPGGRIDSLRPMFQTTLVGTYQLEIVDENACRIVQQVRVEIDTVTIGQRISSQLISCAEPTTQLILDTLHPSLQYRWIFDSVMISTDRQPTVDIGGTYILTTINANGCERMMDHSVPADTVPPKFSLLPDTLDCSTTRLTLRPTTTNGSWNYEWQGPNGLNASRPVLTIDEAGLYTLRATARNQCFTERQVLISADVSFPEIAVEDTFLPCSQDSVRLSFQTNTQLAESNWFGPNGFYVGDSVANTRTPGIYFVVVKAPNGCQAIDSLSVAADPQLVEPNIAVQHIDCVHPTGSIEVLNIDAEYDYTWSSQGNMVSETELTVTTPGTYRLEALHRPSACLLTTQVDVQVDTTAPMIRILENDSIICENREIILGSQVDTSVLYRWRTMDGSILTLDTLSTVTIDMPGNYTIEVTSLHNGCSAIDNVRVDEVFSDLNGLDLQIGSAHCEGANDASIQIMDVIGGNGPYRFSLNDTFYTAQSAFDFLAPSVYQVYVVDVHGCAYDTMVVVDRVPDYDLSFTEDEYLVELGEEIDLTFETTLAEGDWLEVFWSTQPSIDIDSCTLCSSATLTPLQNTEVRLNMVSRQGCIKRDSALIRVSDRLGLFIPNAFTPNGDNTNDFAEVFSGNNIEQILAFEIFDRWGNNVFSAFNFEPGSQEGRWDGTYRGQELNPGVFVYQIKALDIRGRSKVKTGDLVLLR